MRALEDCRFDRLDARRARWTVPEGPGLRFVGRRNFEAALQTATGVPFLLDVDPGQECTEVRSTGNGLLPRGPDDTGHGDLLDFALPTTAAECLGPLAALAPGEYLLVRSPIRPRRVSTMHWGNETKDAEGHHRELHAPRRRPPVRGKTYGPSGRSMPPEPEHVRSLIRGALIGGVPDAPPCLRQPLVALIIQDADILSSDPLAAFLPLAEPAPQQVQEDDLLLVLPLAPPWILSAWINTSGVVLDPDWPARIDAFSQSLTWVHHDY